MASEETMMTTLQDEDFDDDFEDGFDHLLHQHPHPHNLSRLSVCTSRSSTLGAVDDDVDNLASMCISNLSIESFEGDADGEFSDGKEELPATGLMLSSGSENESGGCYSLPATPPRRRNQVQTVKDYASDNGGRIRKEAKNNDPSRRRRRRLRGEHRWVFEEKGKKKKEDQEHVMSGESDQSGSTGTGVMVITRPKGGNRPLCMDLEEVKACRDLGFELEHERMLEIPSRKSLSNSTLDTSSGGNSPISNWRISSPGM